MKIKFTVHMDINCYRCYRLSFLILKSTFYERKTTLTESDHGVNE